MSLISTNFTQKHYSWTEWKAIVVSKSLIYQYADDGSLYTVYGYDGPEAHICQIYKGLTPYTLTAYTQVQNDLDKLDFETNYLANSNKKIGSSIIEGGTDGTKIGNVGDRIKVEAAISITKPQSYSSKLRYLDMKTANGGINRNSQIGSAWVDIFNYSGSGLFVGMLLNFESKGDWFLRLIIDGEDIFDGTSGINLNDMSSSAIYDLDENNEEASSNLLGLKYNEHSRFTWNGPLSTPVTYNTSVIIKARRLSDTKKIQAGLFILTKES